MDTRIAERRADVRHEQMRARRRRTLAVVAVVVAVAAVAWLVESPLLALSEVRVEGNRKLDAEPIRQAADLPLGASTLRLALAEAERRVERLAWVRDASVRRSDPLTVTITVEERRPAMVLLARGRAGLLDRDGVFLGVGTADGLPVIETGEPDLPGPGEGLAAMPAAANAHAVYAELPGPLRTEVSRYLARDADDATLVLRDGTLVRFGRARDAEEKARVVGALLEEAGPVAAIDVRVPGNPVVLPDG